MKFYFKNNMLQTNFITLPESQETCFLFDKVRKDILEDWSHNGYDRLCKFLEKILYNYKIKLYIIMLCLKK